MTQKNFICAFGALIFLHSPIDLDIDNDLIFFFAPSAHLFSYIHPFISTLTMTLKNFLCAFGALIFLHSPIDIDNDNDPKFKVRSGRRGSRVCARIIRSKKWF